MRELIDHVDLGGCITPPRSVPTPQQRKLEGVTSTPKYFPNWFKDVNRVDKQQRMDAPTQWEDYDGSEHPYGNIPTNWEKATIPEMERVPTGRAKKRQPKIKKLDEAYARFMTSIVKGLDEKTRKQIYARAEKFKDLDAMSNTSSEATESSPQNQAQDPRIGSHTKK
jgi:hypothetical protein